jgi:hypothetical protein
VFLSALGVDEEHNIESLLLSYSNDSDNVCVMLYVIYMLSVHRMGLGGVIGICSLNGYVLGYDCYRR